MITINIVVDNKRFRRKLWTKVVESGLSGQDCGQSLDFERCQWT
jgi:hypothetical protein